MFKTKRFRRISLRLIPLAVALLLITVACNPNGGAARIRPTLFPVAAIAASDEFAQGFNGVSPDMLAGGVGVDRDRLLAHLQALAYPRFEIANRDRARRYLIDTLESLGWVVRLDPFESGTGQGTGQETEQGINIVADLPPLLETAHPHRPTLAQSPEILLVGAHYDTVAQSPGADDNGSAMAILLELARLFSPDSSHPQSLGLRLVFFDQEEQGLLGSQAYASQPQNLAGLAGAVILDMVGYTCHQPGCQTFPPGLPFTPPTDRGTFISVIGDQDHPDLIAAFQPAAGPNSPPVLALPVPLGPDLPIDLARSDHVPFWQNNLGAVLITDTANFRNPHYHQPTDTLDTLDLNFLYGVAEQITAGLKTLMNDSSRQSD